MIASPPQHRVLSESLRALVALGLALLFAVQPAAAFASLGQPDCADRTDSDCCCVTRLATAQPVTESCCSSRRPAPLPDGPTASQAPCDCRTAPSTPGTPVPSLPSERAEDGGASFDSWLKRGMLWSSSSSPAPMAPEVAAHWRHGTDGLLRAPRPRGLADDPRSFRASARVRLARCLARLGTALN